VPVEGIIKKGRKRKGGEEGKRKKKGKKKKEGRKEENKSLTVQRILSRNLQCKTPQLRFTGTLIVLI
jgi:hypothetical protein